jgi:hypothetical protein
MGMVMWRLLSRLSSTSRTAGDRPGILTNPWSCLALLLILSLCLRANAVGTCVNNIT